MNLFSLGFILVLSLVIGGTWLVANNFNPRQIALCVPHPLSAEVKHYIVIQVNKNSEVQCDDLPNAVKKVADLETTATQINLVLPILKNFEEVQRMPKAPAPGLPALVNNTQPSVAGLVNGILTNEVLALRAQLSSSCTTAAWPQYQKESTIQKDPQKRKQDDDD